MRSLCASLWICINVCTVVSAQELNRIPEKFFVKSKINVIVFLALDCPISQKYMGTLNELTTQYPTQLIIHGIVPGKNSGGELKRFRKEYQSRFVIQPDSRYHWIDILRPSVTPEVFVYSMKGDLVYQGAIDNWFYDFGSYRQNISENYLKDVITAVLKGEQSPWSKTNAVGCIIQKPVKP